MRHILVILSILLLSSFLISCEKEETYVGERENGEFHGQGTLSMSNGDKYEGEWKDGIKHGQGTYTWSDGEKYVGEWKDGLMNGQGTFTGNYGHKYIGEYRNGKYHGQGTETLPSGDKYVGEFKNGKMNGQGTGTFPDGSKYVGEWKDGLVDGQGTWTFPNGEKYVGEWKDGDKPKKGEKKVEIAKKKDKKEKATAKKKEEKSPGLFETFFEGEKAQSVKYAKLSSCPHMTLEEMAEGFMGTHSWSSGKSEDGNSFVNLKGSVSYHEKKVTALIQFQLNKDETFEFRAIELNEIPQPTMMGLSLLEKMCDKLKEKNSSEKIDSSEL